MMKSKHRDVIRFVFKHCAIRQQIMATIVYWRSLLMTSEGKTGENVW